MPRLELVAGQMAANTAKNVQQAFNRWPVSPSLRGRRNRGRKGERGERKKRASPNGPESEDKQLKQPRRRSVESL